MSAAAARNITSHSARVGAGAVYADAVIATVLGTVPWLGLLLPRAILLQMLVLLVLVSCMHIAHAACVVEACCFCNVDAGPVHA